MDLQPMTTSYCRHFPLSREGNVMHAPPSYHMVILPFLLENIPLPLVKQHVLHSPENGSAILTYL